jgi:hypothetical protein
LNLLITKSLGDSPGSFIYRRKGFDQLSETASPKYMSFRPYKKPGFRAVLLAGIAILYCATQWIGARTIMGSTIFSTQRAADSGDMLALTTTLERDLAGKCASGDTRKIIFDDSDVFLPYVLSIASSDTFSRCELIRETRVTPFTDESLDCKTLGVKELTATIHSANHDFTVFHSQYPGHWTEISQWKSTRGLFGYALFRPASCVAGGEN